MMTVRFRRAEWIGGLVVAVLLGGVLPAAGTPVAGAQAEAPSAVAAPALSPEAGRARILALRREIARHDELYFKKAAPIISDFEYDSLKAELRALEARFPSNEEVPASANGGGVGDDRSGSFATHRHRVPMLSLDKAYSDEEITAFAARAATRIGGGDPVFRVEPKYDGVAVSLTYERGRLVRATTRGDGAEGDDITANALAVSGVAERLREDGAAPWPEVVELRGEIFLPFAELARINDERLSAGEAAFANPRNVAAGSIRLQNTDEIAARRLELVCHGWGAWGPAAGRPASLGEFRDRLVAWGLPVVAEARIASGPGGLNAAIQALRGAGDAGGFPTDGVVVKLERIADQDALGTGPTAPRWAVARKFAPPRAATRLLGITWQVGRTGVLTPVAELAPVELDGSIIARATLHNADEIARRDLRIGDVVFVEKAGEIIPAVVGVDLAVRDPASPAYVSPATCPGCGGPLSREAGKAAHRCVNADCPARVARRIEHLASADALAVEGLGPVLVEELVARGLVRTPGDLFQLQAKDLRGLPGVGARSADKLVAAIGAARERARADGARLIYALGWPGVGREAARRLAKAYDGLDVLGAADEAALRRFAAEGGAELGAAAAKALAAYLASPEGVKERAELIAAGVGVAWRKAGPAGGPMAGQVVVLTGALTRWTRIEAAALLAAAGAQVVSEVTKRTTLVVAGAEPGEKLVKARERGIEVIDEAELARRLGQP